MISSMKSRSMTLHRVSIGYFDAGDILLLDTFSILGYSDSQRQGYLIHSAPPRTAIQFVQSDLIYNAF